MSEQSCRHMREAVPTGACIVCHPEMFPSPERMAATEAWFRQRREAMTETYTPTNGAPQQREQVRLTASARPATAEQPAAAAPPPDPDDVAPWQELDQTEFTILYTLAILARDPDFDGIEIDQLRRELGTTWPEADVQHSLGQLRIKGYAGPYADGLWGIAGKGTDVINDYKLRFARVS